MLQTLPPPSSRRKKNGPAQKILLSHLLLLIPLALTLVPRGGGGGDDRPQMAPTAKERSAVNSQAEVVSLAPPHRTQAEEVGCRFPFLSRGDPKAARVPISDNYLFMPSLPSNPSPGFRRQCPHLTPPQQPRVLQVGSPPLPAALPAVQARRGGSAAARSMRRVPRARQGEQGLRL
jgi:hypothetical protein